MNWKVPAGVVTGIVIGVVAHERITGRAERIVEETEEQIEELKGIQDGELPSPGDFEETFGDPHEFLDSLDNENASHVTVGGEEREVEDDGGDWMNLDDLMGGHQGTTMDDFMMGGGDEFPEWMENMQQQTEDEIEAMLEDDALTIEEIVDEYVDLPPMFDDLAIDGMQVTVDRLVEQGRITQMDDGRYTAT